MQDFANLQSNYTIKLHIRVNINAMYHIHNQFSHHFLQSHNNHSHNRSLIINITKHRQPLEFISNNTR